MEFSSRGDYEFINRRGSETVCWLDQIGNHKLRLIRPAGPGQSEAEIDEVEVEVR